MTTVLLVLAVLALIALNAFFVAAEFALVRARSDRLEVQAEEGDERAALARRVVDEIDEYLSACQLGITMTSIGIGFLGEVALASQLEPLFGDVVSHGVAVVISVAARLPARHGRRTSRPASRCRRSTRSRHADGVARRTARPLVLFRKAFRPFIALLNSVSNWMLRGLGREPRGGLRGGHAARRTSRC